MKVALFALLSVVVVSCSDKAAEKPQPAVVIPPKTKVKDAVAIGQVKEKPQPAKPAVKPGKITNLETGQMFNMQQTGRLHIIDVRPPIFYRLGHIEGAINLPKSKYKSWQPEHLPKIKQAIANGQVVVFYCQNESCTDAYKTAMKFINLGHTVSIYRGGWREWKRAGLE